MSDTRPARVALVTGATGAVGPWVVRSLLRSGYEVRVLARATPPAGLLPPPVSVVLGDLFDEKALSRGLAGADVVFHLAAMLHVADPAPELRRGYWRVNVDGTRSVLEAAARHRVSRAVLFSTILVYGSSAPGVVWDEASALNPGTYYAESKIEAERIALATLPATVLRLSACYGAGLKGNYHRLVEAIRRGRFVMIGDGRNRRTLVYAEDAARAAQLASESPVAAGSVYNVTDGEVHTFREIVEAIADSLGKRLPPVGLPLAPIWVGFGVLDRACGLIGARSPIGRSTLDKLTEDMAVTSTKVQEIGYRPAFDLATGWRRTVAVGPGGVGEVRES